MPILTSCIKGHASKALLAVLFLALAAGQPPAPVTRPEDEPKKLPDGRLVSELMRKQDYKDNLADLDEIKKLTEVVREDLEKSQGHVLSIKSLKNLGEVEKLSRRIRGRMRKF